jgi:beta-fructofuranosidase
VWKESDEKYLMVLGARTRLDEGCVIVYKSSDLESWEFDSLYGIPDFGYMWECPDYFTVGGKAFLSISPQGLPHEKYKFQNVYSSGYFKAGKEPKDYNEWDCGFDFYAPQTFVAPDGRRLLIGWMGIGDIPYTNPTTELGWQHCLTVPRELTLAADGSLRQAPVRELEKLRHEGETLTNGMTAQLPFELCAETSSRFTLDMGGYLVLSYADGVFTMRFNDEKTGGGRGVRNALLFACTDIRILADTSSLEIYLSGGEKVLSSRFYPDDTSVKLTFNGISGTLYELDGMEVSYDGK